MYYDTIMKIPTISSNPIGPKTAVRIYIVYYAYFHNVQNYYLGGFNPKRVVCPFYTSAVQPSSIYTPKIG